MPESKKVRVPTAGTEPSLFPKVMLFISAVFLLISALMRHPIDTVFIIVTVANFLLQLGILIRTLFFQPVFTVEVVEGRPIAVTERKNRMVLSEVTKIDWKKINRSFQLHLIQPSKDGEISNKAIIYLTGESGTNLVRKNKLPLLTDILQATSAPRSGIEYSADKPGYFFPNEEAYKPYQLASIGVDEAIAELGRYVK
jgi:hypothetical protein